MDREQEDLQFLGLFGVYKESFKIITKSWKIFSKISLVLILPLSFFFLAHIEFSNLIFSRWRSTRYLTFQVYPGIGTYHLLFDHMTKERAFYWLFTLAYYIILLIISLLSTSAVVYTIACLYTARDITFKKIMSIVPKVWKRLMITFLCAFLAFFIYNIALVFIILLFVVSIGESNAFVPIFYITIILYFAGFIYLTVVWQLASVVSVLENLRGFKAVWKSKNLIKGKLWIAIFIFFKLNFSLACLQFVFAIWVVYDMIETWKEILIGFSCLVGLFVLILLGLTIQTVIYFVCKSYHHENIDKSALSDHLEVIYLGEYVPLKEKDIQLEQSRV